MSTVRSRREVMNIMLMAIGFELKMCADVAYNNSLQYVCVCAVIPFILDVRLVDIPAGVTTQEEGHTVTLHVPSAVLALIFLARRIQPLSSLVDREVVFCVLTN